MATLSNGGRINEAIVDNEIHRLQLDWSGSQISSTDKELTKLIAPEIYEQLDLFERLQLAQVITICRKSKSMADAGRQLFDKSRLLQTKSNDSQRLRAYLTKYGLKFKSFAKNNE